MYDNNFGFDDEPVDLTAPGRSEAAKERYSRYEQDISRTKDPVIMKVTGILLKAAMVGALLFLFYLISLGDFDIDKNISMLRNAGLGIYGVFLLDAVVMTVLNKQFSILLIALILPVFYPLKRAGVTYDKKNIPALWLAALLILSGVVLNNLYPQLNEKIKLMKTSRDEYSAEYDDAVRYLKGIKVESGDMIIEVVKEEFDDYVWKAEKEADGSYIITVMGDTDLSISGVFDTDDMLKNNTKLSFTVNAAINDYYVSGLKINDVDETAYAKTAWSMLCGKEQ